MHLLTQRLSDNLCVTLMNAVSDPKIYVDSVSLALTNESGRITMSLMYTNLVIIQGDYRDTRVTHWKVLRIGWRG
jgi:hypothetical protein